MAVHPLAGRPAPRESLIDVSSLISRYYERRPDPADPRQRVSFGTSGHRGSALAGAFNEEHVLAIAQAAVEYRAAHGVTGPVFVAQDTHALSGPAMRTTIEVLAGNGVEVLVPAGLGHTPTPVVSHAILAYNRGRDSGLADGIVVTPSHNPPEDGGIKYDPPHGGPADTEATDAIQARANAILEAGLRDVRRVPFERALRLPTTREFDYVTPYVADLASVVDMDAIAAAGLAIGADPLGGASVAYWDPIADRYGVRIEVVNRAVDPAFGFMTLDHDGRIRMDCSSQYAMAGLIGLSDRFDVAFGNDADADRHGIVTRTGGLMNPNHYLAAAISYLFPSRPGWRADAAVGKTLVSSSMIDRVAASIGRRVEEVPVGFKWFVRGLLDGSCAFGGEESAGASFLRMDGTVWTTDKDGILLDLLAAEMTARTGRDPAVLYRELTGRFGDPVYERTDAPATAGERAVLKRLSPDQVRADTLAGDPIRARLTRAPGNGAPIGGLKVVTDNGWFAARPSGTEDVYKVYAESFLGPGHLRLIQSEAREIVSSALRA